MKPASGKEPRPAFVAGGNVYPAPGFYATCPVGFRLAGAGRYFLPSGPIDRIGVSWQVMRQPSGNPFIHGILFSGNRSILPGSSIISTITGIFSVNFQLISGGSSLCGPYPIPPFIHRGSRQLVPFSGVCQRGVYCFVLYFVRAAFLPSRPFRFSRNSHRQIDFISEYPRYNTSSPPSRLHAA